MIDLLLDVVLALWPFLLPLWALGGAMFLTLCWLLVASGRPHIHTHFHVVPDDEEEIPDLPNLEH